MVARIWSYSPEQTSWPWSTLLIAAALLHFTWSPIVAQAQSTPVQRIRGEVVRIKGDMLGIRGRDGDTLSVQVDNDAQIVSVSPASLADIKPGEFIGTAAARQSDGTFRADEVHLFPESMRGTGEGVSPWDDRTTNSETTKSSTATAENHEKGRTLTITFQGGERRVFVPSNAPIVRFSPATFAALRVGAAVFIIVTESPDHTLRASTVAVGQNGAKPPM
jgi:hypothetical protein